MGRRIRHRAPAKVDAVPTWPRNRNEVIVSERPPATVVEADAPSKAINPS